MDRREIFLQAARQLAIEYNTIPEALQKEGVTVTLPAMNEGRRIYSHELPFFSMVTTGNSAVIMANENLRPFVRSLTEQLEDVHRLFEFPNLLKIDGELRKHGYTIRGTYHMYLPGKLFEAREMPSGFTYKWFESEAEIERFYPNTRFPMALSADRNPDRPDVIALAAFDEGGEIAGMSGASADTKDMWQVGIDVLSAYRGRGLGTALVHAVSKRIMELGHLPFYGTAAANLHSQNIAVSCGYRPAWTELASAKLEEN